MKNREKFVAALHRRAALSLSLVPRRKLARVALFVTGATLSLCFALAGQMPDRAQTSAPDRNASWARELANSPAMQAPAQIVGGGLIVSDLNHGVNPTDLVSALVGTGVTISNVIYTGNSRGAGTFTGGTTIIGFDSGIVLGCGKVQTVTGDAGCSRGIDGPNTCHELGGGAIGVSNSTNFGLPGDPQLTALSGFNTFDATVLQFDFVPQFSTVQFQYVFSSEEYSDYANSNVNDVFAFFVNGVNCALVPGTNEPIAINTINNGNDTGGDPTPHHPELFRDNVRPTVTINTQMDGLTVVLTCTSNVMPGVSNHMKLAIADAGDGIFDSAVFLKAESFISGTVITTSLTGGSQTGPMITVLEGTVVNDSATLSGANAGSASGTVNYKVFSDPDCGVLFADAGTKTVTNGQVPASDPVMFNLAGTYYWQASYSGDQLNNPSSNGCGDEIVTVAAPTPTPTPIAISGTISYCPNSDPVPDVTLTLSGDGSAMTMSGPAGNYMFSNLTIGNTYTVTPSKAALPPGSPGINAVDVIAVQKHYLTLGLIPPGCRRVAADVTGDNRIDTSDVVAIERFFLVQGFGTANVGKYKFIAPALSYMPLNDSMTGQDYIAVILGDVAGPFVSPRPGGPSQTAADASAGKVAATVAALSLPNVAVDAFVTNFNVQVTTTAIDAKNKLVGFQGDFTFDERVVTFQSEPVTKAGITGGNWNVSGNVLPGAGPIRTLRISAYSNDFTPLSGSGTLFELNMTRVSKAVRSTPLIWAAAPNQFIFIDADLNTQKPGHAAPGSVTTSAKRRERE